VAPLSPPLLFCAPIFNGTTLFFFFEPDKIYFLLDHAISAFPLFREILSPQTPRQSWSCFTPLSQRKGPDFSDKHLSFFFSLFPLLFCLRTVAALRSTGSSLPFVDWNADRAPPSFFPREFVVFLATAVRIYWSSFCFRLPSRDDSFPLFRSATRAGRADFEGFENGRFLFFFS